MRRAAARLTRDFPSSISLHSVTKAHWPLSRTLHSCLGRRVGNIHSAAPMATTTALMSQMKPRRAYTSPTSSVVQQPASVARRNARERNRVKQVNNGFATLRSHIPASVAAQLLPATPTKGPQGAAAAKKLSKVETLRMAVEYIRSLQAMLQEPVVGSTPSTPTITPCYAPQTPQTPPCSEPSGSPASSYGGGCGNTTGYPHRSSTENARDDYEPMSPEDEELLDVISWWQSQ